MPTHRHFQAAAHNVLHAMASGLAHDGTAFLADHLGHAAARAATDRVRLDLVTGEIHPSDAVSPALVRYAQDWRERWPRIVAGVGGDPAAVRSIAVEVVCDLIRRDPAREFLEGKQAYIVALTCTIVDTAGVSHTSAPPRDQLYLDS